MQLAWREDLGVAYVRYATWGRERSEEAVFLGSIEQPPVSAPALSRASPTRLAYADDAGIRVLSRAAERDREWRAPGASRALAIAGRLVFAEAPAAVVLRELVWEPQLMLHGEFEREAGGALLLSALMLREEALALHSAVGARAFRVVCAGVETSSVQHRVRAPIQSLHAAAGGSRAAFALGLSNGQVRAGLLGAGGRIIERPHDVFPTRLGRLESPRVVWIDQGFSVLARAADSGRLHIKPLGEKGQTFSVPSIGPAYSVASRSGHLYAVEIQRAATGRALALWRCDRRGGAVQKRVSPIVLDGEGVRAQRLQASRTIDSLIARLAGDSSYRGGRTRVSRAQGSIGLLDSAEPVLRFAIDCDGEGPKLELSLGDLGGRVPTQRGLVRRLIARARGLSVGARESQAGALDWARRLLAPLSRVSSLEAEVRAEGRSLRARLSQLPDVAALERLIHRARAERT